MKYLGQENKFRALKHWKKFIWGCYVFWASLAVAWRRCDHCRQECGLTDSLIRFDEHPMALSWFGGNELRFSEKCFVVSVTIHFFSVCLCFAVDITEGPCGRDHHCQGGALCRAERCVCPEGYVPFAGNSKCAKQGGECARNFFRVLLQSTKERPRTLWVMFWLNWEPFFFSGRWTPYWTQCCAGNFQICSIVTYARPTKVSGSQNHQHAGCKSLSFSCMSVQCDLIRAVQTETRTGTKENSFYKASLFTDVKLMEIPSVLRNANFRKDQETPQTTNVSVSK